MTGSFNAYWARRPGVGRNPRNVTRRALILGATIAVASGMVVLAAQAQADDTSPVAPAAKWQPWAELGGYWSSEETSRSEAVVWAPLMQGASALFFIDGRGKLFEEDVSEGNLALGYRQMLASGWNLGIWSGLDVRHTEADNTFWQLSGGLEALSANWDLRVNGYVPLTDPKGSPTLAEVQLAGDQIFMIGGQEVPLYGVDGEVGYRLLGTPETAAGRRHELRVYGGGFWFDASDALQEVAGPKARAEWRIDNVVEAWPGSRLTFEGEFSYDEVRDDRWEVGARLRLPFGGGPEARRVALSLTPQERRMSEGLERDTDIVTVQSKAEGVEDVLTNVDFDRVAQVGDGDSITATSAEAGDETLIIATGTFNGFQELKGNQTLQGGGSTIQVRGLKSGTVASFTAPGSRPTLVQPADNPNLSLLASNTHVVGLSIQGAGPGNNANDGIIGGTGLTNMFIDQLSIADTGGTGIRFPGDNNIVSVSNTVIVDSGNSGIQFADDNVLTVTDTTITGAGGNGIGFGDRNVVTISNTAIADVTFNGIGFGNFNTATISGTSVRNAGQFGIGFTGSNTVMIAVTTISGVVFDGIAFGSGNTVEIAGTAIANTGSAGINFADLNTVTIANTTIIDPAGDGIQFDNNNVNVTIKGTAIKGALNNGIAFLDGNTVTVADTTLTNILLDGIVFVDNNTVTIARANLTNLLGNGITFDGTGGGNEVGITDTSIAIAAVNGVSFGNNNNVAISGTRIVDIGGDGVFFFGNNSVDLANSVLAGNIGGDGLQINVDNNTLSGIGNEAAGATFGGQFCLAVPQANATFFSFDIGTCP